MCISNHHIVVCEQRLIVYDSGLLGAVNSRMFNELFGDGKARRGKIEGRVWGSVCVCVCVWLSVIKVYVRGPLSSA